MQPTGLDVRAISNTSIASLHYSSPLFSALVCAITRNTGFVSRSIGPDVPCPLSLAGAAETVTIKVSPTIVRLLVASPVLGIPALTYHLVRAHVVERALAPLTTAATKPLEAAPAKPVASIVVAAPVSLQKLDFGTTRPSPEVVALAQWIATSGDNHGLPFVLIDKREATVFVFAASGALLGASAALLGSAHGDVSVPGIGQRAIAAIRPAERTTPAGRFVAEPGRNANGEDIVWVSYDEAVSMHRLRDTNPLERRSQRLASATAKDNRITYGCINLPPSFFNSVVSPLFSRTRGIVYILPESGPVETMFRASPGDANPVVAATPLNAAPNARD